MILTTQDKNGTPIELTKYFTLYDPSADFIPLKEAFSVFPIKTSGEPGEVMQIAVGTADDDLKILYEVEYDNQLIIKKWLKLDNEQKILEIPIIEKYRGNFTVHLNCVKNNQNYSSINVCLVPWTNKQLKLSFETFRNKLLPGTDEEWKIKVSGPDGEKVSAEMLASMYDASLDAFVKNYWSFNVFPYFSSGYNNWTPDNSFSVTSSNIYQVDWNQYYGRPSTVYDRLNYFGYYFYGYGYGDRMMYKSEMPAAVEERELAADELLVTAGGIAHDKGVTNSTSIIGQTFANGKINGGVGEKGSQSDQNKLNDVVIRKNLQETAFFYPHLETNKEGEIVFSFKVPEALTRWNFMGFSHTKDLKSGFLYATAVTQKDLMIQPNCSCSRIRDM